MDKRAQPVENPDSALESPSSTPEHKVHYERADVAIWKREAEGRMWYSLSVTRSYKDQDGRWQRTSSLDEEDILPAARALEDAYTWIQKERQKARDEALGELRP